MFLWFLRKYILKYASKKRSIKHIHRISLKRLFGYHADVNAGYKHIVYIALLHK